MKPPEMTQDVRNEVAAALAILIKHNVSAFRATEEDWPEAHWGVWVVPTGNAHDNTQAFRPFWMNKDEVKMQA